MSIKLTAVFTAMGLSALVGCSGATTTNGTATAAPDPTADTPTGDTGGGTGPDAAYPSLGEAPGFSLPTLDGDNISLSDFKGNKVVLLDFWSTTCDPCLAEMPELVKLYNEKKAQGFEILAISTDDSGTRAAVSSTVKKHGMVFPILLDDETEVMDRYNPKGDLPFTVVVDKGGSIILKRASYTPGDTKSWASLVGAIDSALKR